MFLISWFSLQANSAQWAVRAREHFESHEYKYSGQKIKYTGLTNTINIWREEPYKWALGLALGPVIGSAKEKNSGAALGEEIQLSILGVEGKYFPFAGQIDLFTRLGITYSKLDTEMGPDDPDGIGYYAGVGYEFRTEMLGIALEFGIRYVDLSSDITGTIVTPSIGFHFYDMLHF